MWKVNWYFFLLVKSALIDSLAISWEGKFSFGVFICQSCNCYVCIQAVTRFYRTVQKYIIVVLDSLLLNVVIIVFSSSGVIFCGWQHYSQSKGQWQWHQCSSQTERQAQDSLETRSREGDSCGGEGTWWFNSTSSSQVKTYPYTGAL